MPGLPPGLTRHSLKALEGKIRLARSSLSNVSWRDFEDDLRRSESHFRESEKRRTRLGCSHQNDNLLCKLFPQSERDEPGTESPDV